MKAAASASGGCIVALLFRPYTPTTSVRQAFGGHLVQVGRYQGALSTCASTSLFPAMAPGRARRPAL